MSILRSAVLRRIVRFLPVVAYGFVTGVVITVVRVMTASEPAIARLESLGAVLDDYRDPTGKEPFGQVYVKLKNWRGSLSDLELIGKIPNVSALCVDASRSRLRDGDVERLAGMPALKVLDISRTSITGTALSYLKGAKDLEKLWLDCTDITDADLHALSALSRLSTLGISRTRVKGQLVPIPEGVKAISLSGTPLEKLTLVSGVSRAALVELRLDDTCATDAMLEDVEKCPNLESLWLDRTQVTDRGLVRVGKLRKLIMLSLDDLEITDAGIEAIRPLSELRWLMLSGTKITDKGFVALGQLRKLEEAIHQRTVVTADGVQKLESRLGRSIGTGVPLPK